MSVSKRFALGFALALLTLAGRAQGQDERPLTLRAALAAARTRSAGAREARARAEAADVAALATLGGYLPSVSARLAGSKSWSSTFARVSPVRRADSPSEVLTGEAYGRMVWTAFDFGRTPSLVGSARAYARAAGSRAEAAANEAVREVASAYLTAIFDEALVENARATVQLRERHTALARGLVASGIRPPVEEARARVELEAARVELLEAEAQTAQDRVRLRTLLVLDPTAPLTLVRPGVLRPASTKPGAAAVEAVARLPEARAVEEDVRAQSAELDAAKAARLPQLGAQLDAAAAWAQPDTSGTTRHLTALVTVSIPVFDLAVWTRPAIERAMLEASEARAAGTLARLRGAAAEAAYQVQSSHAVRAQSNRAAEVAAASLAVMEARYQSGLAGPIDLFDAGSKDADARRVQVHADLQLAVATVALLAATGRTQELEQ